jgi:hypothetical protein
MLGKCFLPSIDPAPEHRNDLWFIVYNWWSVWFFLGGNTLLAIALIVKAARVMSRYTR